MDKSERRIIGSVIWRTLAAIALLLLCIFAERANAQEQYIRACQTSYACQLTPPGGASWAAGVQTYVFTPMSPDVSLRINVHNQNTTSAHTAQTITLWITSSTTANFSLLNNADRWVQAAIIQNSTANASCIAVAANNALVPGASGQGTCYAQGMYAAQIAIQFTPGGAQAGAPDFFDIDIVQCTSNHCNYPGGPQPGNDSSAGGGTGTQLSAVNMGGPGPISGVSTFQLNCNAVNALCVPEFAPTLLGSGAGTKQTRPIDATNVTPTTGQGVQQSLAVLQGTSAGVSTVAAKSLSVANTVAAGTAVTGVQATTGIPAWSVAIQNTNSNCSASTAAVAAIEHCATGVTVCVTATAAQTNLFANLRNGATGAGTVIWNGSIADTAGLSGCITKTFSSPLCGSVNTAMTLELSGATAVGNQCATTLEGIDAQ